MPRNPAYAPEVTPAPAMSTREALHVAMASIALTDQWWSMPEDMAVSKGVTAARGVLSAEVIKVELRAMRADRGLPPVPAAYA
jgi:hypothetical protein